MSQGPKEIFAYEFHNKRHWNSRELECASWSGLEPVRYVRGDIADEMLAALKRVQHEIHKEEITHGAYSEIADAIARAEAKT